MDDDIKYPTNYVDSLTASLANLNGAAVVGAHARVFVPPHNSYVLDAVVYHFARDMANHCHVHELGTGTCAFLSNVLTFDVRKWPYRDTNDILLAIEAQKRGIPRISVKRPSGWIQAHTEGQKDSLWHKKLNEHTRPSDLMRALLKLY